MAANLTAALAAEYQNLFANASIRPERLPAVTSAVDRIFSADNMKAYKRVSAKTNIPPWFVGIIHNMESGLSFRGHLHNGDPLTARTRQVPKGRPTGGSPPFTWDDSAIDALSLKSLERWSDWSVSGIAFQLERYNGWGYRNHHPEVKSPYLWSFTTVYGAGKYVADGKWSSTAVSKQVGGMALLRHMVDRQLVKLDGTRPAKAASKTAARAASADPGAPAEPAAGLTLAPDAVPYPGKTVQHGSRGTAVKQLQKRLNALGIDVGMVDGDFGDKTDWGVRLFQARSEDSTGQALEIDGIVGRRTWAALFGEGSLGVAPPPAQAGKSKLAADALAVAMTQIGVMEDPLGSNRGAEVDAYLASVDRSLLGNPWCMAFVYWCFEAAAKDKTVPLPKSASVWRSWELAQGKPRTRIVTNAEARRNPSLVVPGMVFYIDTGGKRGHTGFVAGIVDGRLATIEGNTTLKEGSREGIGVFSRQARRIDSINMGFIEFG